MSDEPDVIISCPECGAVADYDTACPNGCDPLEQYISEDTVLNISEEDRDVLSSISLVEAVELIKQWLDEE